MKRTKPENQLREPQTKTQEEQDLLRKLEELDDEALKHVTGAMPCCHHHNN